MNKKKLKEVADELENASKMHAGQAKKIKSMLKYNKPGPFKMNSRMEANLDKAIGWSNNGANGTRIFRNTIRSFRRS